MTSKIMQIIACIIQKMEYSTGKDENNLSEEMEKTTCMSWNNYWQNRRNNHEHNPANRPMVPQQSIHGVFPAGIAMLDYK